MKLNRDKNVGRILFFVEGEKTEFQLLQRIFVDLLGYRVLSKKRWGGDILTKGEHSKNEVALIKAKTSAIASAGDISFQEQVFEELHALNFPVDKAAIFFLFDRDPSSNVAGDAIRKMLELLHDPYDNEGIEGGRGMLLLSYPSVESHIVTHFPAVPYEQFECSLGKHLKTQMGAWRREHGCAIAKIDTASLMHATAAFIRFYEQNLGLRYEVDNLEHRGLVSFDYEEAHAAEHGQYQLFSQLVQAFIYLGIIELG